MHRHGRRIGLVGALVWAGLFAPTLVLQASALDDAGRDGRLQPERVMDAIGVRPGMVIGEAGAGQGYFTFKLARRVGDGGKVFANDIDRAALEHIRLRCRTEGVRNIEPVVGEVDDPLFPQPALDMAVMVYALHDFAHPAAFLNSLKRYLKPGGTVVILDQNPEASGDRHFLSRERLVELFHESGYELMADERFLERDLLLVFRPS
jgi:ubiquinone/menaquinone biosynthesis C-methylase UbiE